MVDERHQRGGSGGDGEPLDAVEGAVSPSSSSSSVSAETSPPSPNASPASDSAHRNGQGANSSPVERTSGNAKVPCATCRGDGVLPCSACVQRFGMRSNRCPQCRGSGIEFCRACDGTGYAMRSVTQRETRCSRDGRFGGARRNRSSPKSALTWAHCTCFCKIPRSSTHASPDFAGCFTLHRLCRLCTAASITRREKRCYPGEHHELASIIVIRFTPPFTMARLAFTLNSVALPGGFLGRPTAPRQ
eukprot:ctg_1265.g454